MYRKWLFKDFFSKKKSNLTVHLRASHEGLRPFICTIEGCTKDFKHKYQLDKHLNNHDKEVETDEVKVNKKRKIDKKEIVINSIIGLPSYSTPVVPGYFY